MLRGDAATAAGLAFTGLNQQAALAAVTGAAQGGVFAFGVASGDPTATEVLSWTRVTPTPQSVAGSGVGPDSRVTWDVAADKKFTRVLRCGTVGR